MDAGEKLFLYHILEKHGYVICEEKDDVDPRIITVKLWHKPIDTVELLEYAMSVGNGGSYAQRI